MLVTIPATAFRSVRDTHVVIYFKSYSTPTCHDAEECGYSYTAHNDPKAMDLVAGRGNAPRSVQLMRLSGST